MMIRPLASLLALATACTGSIEGVHAPPTDPAPPPAVADPPVPGQVSPPMPAGCALPPRRIWALTPPQYLRTVRALLPTAASADGTGLAATLAWPPSAAG
jgi:hypothetical protein